MDVVEKAKNLLLERDCNNCIYQTFKNKPIAIRCLLDDFPNNIREYEICDDYVHEDVWNNINFRTQTQFLTINTMHDLNYFIDQVGLYKEEI